MAIGLVMTFEGVGKEDYERVMAPDNLDLRSPDNPDGVNDWPAGGIAHWAGSTPTGWCVVDVWESQAHFDAFVESRLGPALAKASIPQPNVVTFDVYNSGPS